MEYSSKIIGRVSWRVGNTIIRFWLRDIIQLEFSIAARFFYFFLRYLFRNSFHRFESTSQFFGEGVYFSQGWNYECNNNYLLYNSHSYLQKIKYLIQFPIYLRPNMTFLTYSPGIASVIWSSILFAHLVLLQILTSLLWQEFNLFLSSNWAYF